MLGGCFEMLRRGRGWGSIAREDCLAFCPTPVLMQGRTSEAYLSVTAPSEALEASLANFASTPRV